MSHNQYLNDYFTGRIAGSTSCGELYNDDPVTKDARFCGTTASMCGIEQAIADGNQAALDDAIRLDVTLHAYMLTQSGIPMLYSGDEIGQLNDYSYREDPDKAADSRYVHRGAFRWELAKKRKAKTGVQGQLFQALQKLEKIRREEPVFGADANVYTYDVHNDSILCILREKDGELFMGMFNFSDSAQTAWMQEKGTFTELLTEKLMELKNPVLPPHGFYWVKRG